MQLAVGLVTKGLPCLRLFSDDKEETKVYEMFADAFMPMQVQQLRLVSPLRLVMKNSRYGGWSKRTIHGAI